MYRILQQLFQQFKKKTLNIKKQNYNFKLHFNKNIKWWGKYIATIIEFISAKKYIYIKN